MPIGSAARPSIAFVPLFLLFWLLKGDIDIDEEVDVDMDSYSSVLQPQGRTTSILFVRIK